MKYCTQCQNSFPDAIEVCPNDKTQLTDFDVKSILGTTIDGKYQVQTLLGVGGMGAVFRARHIFINNDVAIKLINPKLAVNNEIAERFLREARAAAMIDHPNAVKVTDFGRTNEMLYLVMEFIQGYSLTNLIHKKGKLAPATVATIMTQICAALDAAHGHRIIHRDLKPDNIMIKQTDRGQNVIKVFDFGIAKLVQDDNKDNNITRAGTIVGTLNYMSPEQCRGDNEIDARSDIYSLGVVAFEMLTGKLPFTAPTPTGLAVKHIVDQPPSLRTFVPELPEEVDQVVLRALSKDPNARYSSAGEFAHALADVCYDENADKNVEDDLPGLSGPSTGGYGRPKTSIIDRAATTGGTAKVRTGEAAAPATAASRRTMLSIAAGVLLVVLIGGGYFAYNKLTARTPAAPGSQTVDPAVPGMVLIHAGWFKMGETGFNDDEAPIHEVFVNDFYIDETEVTNAQFEKFVTETKYVTDAEKAQEPIDWRTYSTADRVDHPVVMVSWNDASAYARWANKRLLTEAEWEYAARGGIVGKKYPWGDENPKEADRAVFGNEELSDEVQAGLAEMPTRPAKSGPPNGYGLYNLAGNVKEWVQDWYDKNYYETSPKENPKGPSKGDARVLRGGSWYTPLSQIRVSTRISDTQGGTQFDYGFRCAKDKK